MTRALLVLVAVFLISHARAAERPADVYILSGQSNNARRDVYLIKHYASGQPLRHGWDKEAFHDGPPAP